MRARHGPLPPHHSPMANSLLTVTSYNRAQRCRPHPHFICKNLSVALSIPKLPLENGVDCSGDGGSAQRRPLISQPNFQANEMTPPLAAIVDAFQDLADLVENSKDDLRLKPFSDACALVSVLFGSLGIAFKFAELEYNVKVRSLAEASKELTTLDDVLDNDVEGDMVRSPGSYSRNLRRVRQGLDLIRVLFEQFLTCDCSLRNAASTAYYQTCGQFHTWAVRTSVAAGMYALPTREQLLLRLNETDQSAEKRMRRYIEVSSPIINYIDKLYTSRDITLDW